MCGEGKVSTVVIGGNTTVDAISSQETQAMSGCSFSSCSIAERRSGVGARWSSH